MIFCLNLIQKGQLKSSRVRSPFMNSIVFLTGAGVVEGVVVVGVVVVVVVDTVVVVQSFSVV